MLSNRFYKYQSLIIFSLILCLSGCETILPLQFDSEKRLAITSIGTCDSTFCVKLNSSIGAGDMFFSFLDRDLKVHNTSSELSIPNAKVTLTINNSNTITLQYDTHSNKYISDYIVREGDILSVDAVCDGYQDTHAEVSIPNKPRIDVLDITEVYSPPPFIIDESGMYEDHAGNDTLVLVKLRFKDIKEEKNFYRLRVRTVSGHYEDLINRYSSFANDIFISNDIIFHNNLIDKPYNGWPAYFFNVFDDSKIDGKEHTFTIEIRKREYYGEHFLCIDFESISEDLYKYLVAERRYQISDKSVFDENVFIPSNIQNGFGILGGMSCDRKIFTL